MVEQDIVAVIRFFGGITGVLAFLGFLLVWTPRFWHYASKRVFNSVDFEELDKGSAVIQHLEDVKILDRDLHTLQDEITELRKDSIKNTLLMLFNRRGDHSREVAYELDKLEKLNAQCWVMDMARAYIDKHMPAQSDSEQDDAAEPTVRQRQKTVRRRKPSVKGVA